MKRSGLPSMAPGTRTIAARLLVVVPLLSFGAIASCALLIDLGDEPTLLPPDSGTEAASVDSGSDVDAADASALFACGLRPSQNAACRTCIESACCEVSKTCALDPDCVAGLECVKTCLASAPCVSTCLLRSPNLAAVTDCSSLNCTVCSPGPACRKLGQCCAQLADGGAEGLLRNICAGVILDVDETKCDAQRAQVANEISADAGSPCR